MIRSCPLSTLPDGLFTAMLSAALLLVTLAACDDPSTVGTELIGAQGGTPVRVEIPLEVDTVHYDATTGLSALTAQSRLLVGQTQNDPLGETSATGHLDFSFDSGPSDIEDQTLQSVELRLAPTYAYGDTTQTATFALHDMTEEWDPAGAPADTSLADIVEQTPITEFTLASGDTLATIELPDAWIREHADELKSRDSVFANRFHGFQIEPISEGTVTGFRIGESSLQSVFEQAPGDTTNPEATYGATKLLSTIRQPSPQQPTDRITLQDGTGRALQFSFSLPDSLQEASLNRASLVFEVDSTLVTTPLDFARPALDNVQVYATPKDEEGPRPLGIQGAAVILSRNEARFQTDVLIDIVQSTLVGDDPFKSFQLRPFVQTTIQTPFGNQSVPLFSLNAIFIRTDGGHEPHLRLTYTPTE